MKRRHPVPVLFLLFWLAGCGGPDVPALPALPPDATILAFGDSLTYGTGAQAAESYPAVLAALTQRNIVNAGVPGELTAAGRARLPELLVRHRPQLLILIHGGNDLLQQRGEQQAAENIRAMVGLARAANIPVVLVGVPKPGLLLATAPFYAQIARERALPYTDDLLVKIMGDRDLKSDPVHPNAAGYRRLAEGIYSLLRNARAV